MCICNLLYAKEKADILIVNITADVFVDKGEDRPHVPEGLRAANMAAFEMVDFVVIDDHRKCQTVVNPYVCPVCTPREHYPFTFVTPDKIDGYRVDGLLLKEMLNAGLS